MRALKGAVPRGLRDHRTRAGVEYLRFVGAKLERFGGVVPRDARVWLREAGLLVVALSQLHAEVEAATLVLSNGAGRRARDRARVQLRQLERRQARLRASLEAAERRLEELAGKNGHGAPDLAKRIQEATRGDR